MNIHQMSVNYAERDDRLLLRVNTQDGQEFRLWLTRRMTGRLLPHLQACVVQIETRNPQPASDGVRSDGAANADRTQA